jgi:TRAP-type uncharacterized transport system fused permease subunit
MVTPPVCIAVYTAAAIAEAPNMMRCARHSMKLSIGAFIVPFVMLYKPGLNFFGETGGIIMSIITTAVGIAIFAIVLEGYFLRKMSWIERSVWTIAGILILLPHWESIASSLVIIGISFLIHLRLFVKEKRVTGGAAADLSPAPSRQVS